MSALPIEHEHDRRQYIGGSDVPAVLGLSPWTTPLELYNKKISTEPEEVLTPEREDFFQIRKEMEGPIARMLEKRRGIEITRLSIETPNRYIDQSRPYLAAEIDFECVMTDRLRSQFPHHTAFCEIPNGTTLNGEIKTVNAFKSGEWQDDQGNADLPIHYASQAMHGLGVAPGKRPATIVAALIGLDQLLAFPVVRDDQTIAGMRERCAVFWQHVVARIPPAPSNLDEIKALYKQFRGTRVELDDEAYVLFKRRFECAEAEKKAREMVDSLDFQIAQHIYRSWGKPSENNAYDGPEYERAILVYDGHQVGSWNRQAHSWLNQPALKAAFPDVVKLYTMRSNHRVMRQKKGPK